jgi:hypothetical protein
MMMYVRKVPLAPSIRLQTQQPTDEKKEGDQEHTKCGHIRPTTRTDWGEFRSYSLLTPTSGYYAPELRSMTLITSIRIVDEHQRLHLGARVAIPAHSHDPRRRPAIRSAMINFKKLSTTSSSLRGQFIASHKRRRCVFSRRLRRLGNSCCASHHVVGAHKTVFDHFLASEFFNSHRPLHSPPPRHRVNAMERVCDS